MDVATTTAYRTRTAGLLVAAAVLALTCLLSLAIGTQNVGLSTVWRALTDYTDTGNEWIRPRSSPQISSRRCTA